MSGPVYGPHQARNGRHLLRFTGCVLGAASSEHPDSPRWSELVVYGLTNSSYVRSKIGRSLVVHAPNCPLVDWHMTAWMEVQRDAAERSLRRVPCAVCQPAFTEGWDPHTMVESTRYSATVASDPEELAMLLTSRRAGKQPRLIEEVIQQVCIKDPAFASYWASQNITAPPARGSSRR